MAEGGDTGDGGKGGGAAGNGANDGGKGNSNSTGGGTVGGGTPGGGLGGGGDNNSNTSDSDAAAPAAPDADTTTTAPDTDPSKSTDAGFNFAGILGTDLANTKANLSLSDDAAKAAALSASFGAMPGSFGSLATDTAASHLGKAGLQGVMAGFAAESGKLGLSTAAKAATNPAAIVSSFSSFGTKSLGMDTTTHNMGNMIGAYLGSPMGPVGAALGGVLGTFAAEFGLDAFDARDNEIAKDVMEDNLGTLAGRLASRSMSELSMEGFNRGLSDPSLSDLDAYTAGVIGQAKAVAEAAQNLGDPTEGIGSFAASFSDPSVSINTNPGMSMSSEIADTLSKAENILSQDFADRSGELGSIGVTASSTAAQEASMNALGDNTSFTPARSYGWLRAGLPVSAPSSPYRSSYWDGTRFVNMNDYRGFM